MGQSEVLWFLEKYKRSKKYTEKKWLTTKEIYGRLKNTKKASGLSSITNSLKKLRDIGMIRYEEKPVNNSNRLAFYYQAK